MHWNLRGTRRPSEATVLEGGKDGLSPWDTHAYCPRAAAWGRSGEAGGPAAPGSDQDHSQPRPAGPLQSTNTQGLSVTVGVKGPLGPPLHAGAPKRPLQPDAAPHPRITEPTLTPPDLHCRVPSTTRSIRVHAGRRAPPERAPPTASPPQKPFFSSSNSGQNPQPRPYTPNCSPFTKPAGSDFHPEPTCPHLCTPHHPGPGCRWELLLGLPTPASAPRTAPKETAVRSDPISATQILLVSRQVNKR